MTSQVTPTFVPDASVTVTWLMRDEASPLAEEAGAAILRGEAIVPPLWHVEMANAFLLAERRKRIHGGRLIQLKEIARRLPLTIDVDMTKRSFDTVIMLAREYGLTAYDASYLELALRRGLSLATLDKELMKAAKEAGVKMFIP